MQRQAETPVTGCSNLQKDAVHPGWHAACSVEPGTLYNYKRLLHCGANTTAVDRTTTFGIWLEQRVVYLRRDLLVFPYRNHKNEDQSST